MTNILVYPNNMFYLTSVAYYLHELVFVVPFVSQHQRSLNFLGADVSTCPSFRGILKILSVNTNFLSHYFLKKILQIFII